MFENIAKPYPTLLFASPGYTPDAPLGASGVCENKSECKLGDGSIASLLVDTPHFSLALL